MSMQATIHSATDGFRYFITRDDETGVVDIVLQVRVGEEWRNTQQRIGIELRDARSLVGAIGRLVMA